MSTLPREVDPEGFRGRRPSDVRSTNASAVLRYLLAHGATPRSVLADSIGLTRGPVTRIVALLMESGLVQEAEAEPRPPGRGRPRVPIAINPDALHAIAVHIGVTQVTACRVDLAGSVLVEMTDEHDGTPDSVLDITARLCRELEQWHPAAILGIGAVTGGWVDGATGMVRDHPGLHWRDVPVRRRLQEATGFDVFLDSAAHSHSVADIVYGLVAGSPDFVHIFIGNVIEMASANEGRVRSGIDGFGGDLSHWMFDVHGEARSALEVISDFAVRDRARAEGLISSEDTFEDLVSLAPLHQRAETLIIERAQQAAQLVAGIATMLAPTAIVISSGVVATEAAVHALEIEYARRMGDRPHPRLLFSPHWRTPLATAGAAIVVERALLRDPLRRGTTRSSDAEPESGPGTTDDGPYDGTDPIALTATADPAG